VSQLRQHLREREVRINVSAHAARRAHSRCGGLGERQVRKEVREALTSERRSYHRPRWLVGAGVDRGKRLPTGMQYVWTMRCNRVYVLRSDKDAAGQLWVVLTVLVPGEAEAA
jgi:hypothetical protein